MGSKGQEELRGFGAEPATFACRYNDDDGEEQIHIAERHHHQTLNRGGNHELNKLCYLLQILDVFYFNNVPYIYIYIYDRMLYVIVRCIVQ